MQAVGGLEAEAKQRVLEDLLRSPAFGRSDQLRQMLRYMVEEELAGRGDQLSEYSIGVNALGRPADYLPDVDSTVRSRAHDLRKRMEEHFRSDHSGGWRIELPKGTYRARFIPPAGPVEPAPAVASAPAISAPTRFWPGFLAGIGLCALAALAWWLWPAAASERAARVIWGPLLTPGTPVSLLVANVPQLWVREFGDQPLPVHDPPYYFSVPSDPRFPEWYRGTMLSEPRHLILHPNHHSPLGGEAQAAVRLAAFLAARQVPVEMLSGDRAGAIEIKDRNAVVIGRPEYSRAALALQPPAGFSVKYVPERREVGVVSADGRRAFFREKGGSINYGLITVLTRQTDAGPRRTVLVAGINSDGSDAAMDYLTSLLNLPGLLHELSQHGSVPPAYQIVVRSRSNDTRMLQSERVAIEVLP